MLWECKQRNAVYSLVYFIFFNLRYLSRLFDQTQILRPNFLYPYVKLQAEGVLMGTELCYAARSTGIVLGRYRVSECSILVC
jgi:hypothetical protein